MNRLNKNEEEIRKTLNEQQFDFDESQWEAAKVLLDREMPVERKKRRGIFWLWLLPLLALLGAGGWWTYDNKDTLFATEPTITKLKPILDEDAPAPSRPSAVVPQNMGGGVNDTNYTSAIINEINWDDSNEKQATTGAEYQINGGPPALMAALLHKTETKTEATPINSAAAGSNDAAEAEAHTRRNTSPAPEKPKTLSVKPQVPRTPKTNNAGGMSDDGPELDLQPEMPDTGGKLKTADNGGDTKANTPDLPQDIVTDSQEITMPKLKDTSSINTKAGVKKTAPDTTEKVAPETTKKKTKQVLLKNSISPLVAGSFVRELSPNVNNYKFTPYFGILYNRQMGERWQIAGGVGYTSVNASGLSKQYSSETYSFGVQRSQTEISTQKLYYVDIPVLARFSANDYLSVIGGINAGILINTKNTFTQSAYTSLNGNTSESKNTTAYRKGFGNIDWQLQLGLEGHFFKQRLHVGFLANNSLRDVTVNNYYNNAAFDRNRRIQLYLRYDVIRF